MSLRPDIDRLKRRFVGGDESARADLRELLQRYIRIIATRALRRSTPRSAIDRRIVEFAARSGLESFGPPEQIQRLAFEISDRLSDKLLGRPRVQPNGDEPGSTTIGPAEKTVHVSRC